MQLSKTGYYADFAIYAAGIAGIATAAAVLDDARAGTAWVLAAVAGAAAWTLIEYLLHRFVLHRMPPFEAMHDVHHQAPRAFVGTPTWLSLGVIALVIFLPAWASSSLNVASGLAAGVMAGFFWYGVVHHTIHYRRPRLLAARMVLTIHRHFEHHYSPEPGNYGVTFQFWDRMFGTALPDRNPGRAPPPAPEGGLPAMD